MSDPVALNATVAGDGPPLLIIHGLFGQAKNWGGLIRQFGRSFTVHALDLRNHGTSPRARPTDYPAMAADIGRYIEDHRLEQPGVIGHSMGGKASMWLALTQPGLIGRLVIADVAPVAYRHNFDRELTALRAIDPASLTSRTEADQIMAGYLEAKPVRDFLLTNLVRGDDGGWCWLIDIDNIAGSMPDITGWPTPADHARFNGPALFLSGGRSDYVTPSMHAEILQRFPAASFTSLPESGHWLHAENPQGFMTACLPFLQSA